MILKIKLKCFQINLMLELFVLKVGIIKIILKFLLIGDNLFFQNFYLIFWSSFCLHFFLNMHHFFHFSPRNNCQVRKFEPQKMVVSGKMGS